MAMKDKCKNLGQEACQLSRGGYECVDVSSSLEMCGACSIMVSP